MNQQSGARAGQIQAKTFMQGLSKRVLDHQRPESTIRAKVGVGNRSTWKRSPPKERNLTTIRVKDEQRLHNGAVAPHHALTWTDGPPPRTSENQNSLNSAAADITRKKQQAIAQDAMTAATRTHLAFQYDAKSLSLQTTIQSVRPFAALEEANQCLFKQATQDDHVVVTKETIFHPQGGGQPSDEGTMTAVGADASGAERAPVFQVKAARMDAVHDGQVLHLGRFASPADGAAIRPGDAVEQAVDAEKRLLYSRLHTAGHVLGSAVRSLLEDQIPGFDELKASHFPDSAACEFRGSIEGRWKEPIQTRVDEYVSRAMPVDIDFWTEDDFRREGLERLIPDRRLLPPGEDRFRVVRIVGAEVYPCGGTHVDTTDLCGSTVVKKISRGKGISRVSYTVSDRV
ncbi:Alanyl-tRNA editing protein AlaX-L [Tolypocladium ophioglossoides CBS 100239]|uniref:Alanyl-tRNA editing protein AlaX-L n=1 Tax=Tolypocladium ophioglossoides (strain CBS 100239) TaxID=1163406 RepID=A0A0L0NDP3_TOLOC|nr:Alanyl-tRNA editing protein AlaX-L [Tolypocladium ophioglossoides CBS 100239]